MMIFLIMAVSLSYGQLSAGQSRFSLSYGITDNSSMFYYKGYYGNAQFNAAMNLSDYFSAGVYLGSAGIPYVNYWTNAMENRSNQAIYYGITGTAHLLQLNMNKPYTVLDLYVKAKAGAYTYRDFDASSFTTTFDYGLYGGAAWYFSKHFGVFLEVGYGAHSFSQFGLLSRF